MKQLRKFLHLSWGDRQLLFSTILLLSTIRLGLRLLRFQTLQHLLIKMIPRTTVLPLEQASVNKVVWAVEVVSRYMPGGVKCLARALATQVLLGRRGYMTQLRIGVAKSEAGQLEAHAWVESQGRIVIGGLESLTRFTPLGTLELERS